ncbi:MAG: glycosyltransferase [Planctomycetes bacterium]|jgi:glycosyltransferase involved in cell wall biosynthesis|nr:glycosyltransferase [Planctomycetota bacterium]
MNQQPKSLSIVIATHNRVKLLLQTLQSLSQLAVPPGVEVELIICANACTDDTVETCSSVLAGFPFPGRCLVEPRAGASQARNTALSVARGDIVAFLDDDIWISAGWIEALLTVFQNYPADIVAGKVELWWKDVARPVWLSRRSEHMLSCVDHGEHICELFSAGEVAAANLAIRRDILADVPGFRTDLGRSERALLAGEDTFFVAQALKSGHRLFYAPQASLLHWVAPERITPTYLGRAAEGIGTAKALMLPTISTRNYLRLGMENRIKFMIYGVLEWFSTLLGYEKGRINQHIRRMMSHGVLLGLRQRRTSR